MEEAKNDESVGFFFFPDRFVSDACEHMVRVVDAVVGRLAVVATGSTTELWALSRVAQWMLPASDALQEVLSVKVQRWLAMWRLWIPVRDLYVKVEKVFARQETPIRTACLMFERICSCGVDGIESFTANGNSSFIGLLRACGDGWSPQLFGTRGWG